MPAGQLIAGGAQLVIVAPLVAGAPPTPAALSAEVVGSVLALGALGTGVAFVLNFRVIQLAGASNVGVGDLPDADRRHGDRRGGAGRADRVVSAGRRADRARRRRGIAGGAALAETTAGRRPQWQSPADEAEPVMSKG